MTFVFTIAAPNLDGVPRDLSFDCVVRDIRHDRYAITISQAVRPNATSLSRSDHFCVFGMKVGHDTVRGLGSRR